MSHCQPPGVQGFIKRRIGKIQLTHFGEKLVRYVHRGVDHRRVFVDVLQVPDTGQAGDLSIGMQFEGVCHLTAGLFRPDTDNPCA